MLDAVSVPGSETGNTAVVIILGVVVAVLGLTVLRRRRPLVLLPVVLWVSWRCSSRPPAS